MKELTLLLLVVAAAALGWVGYQRLKQERSCGGSVPTGVPGEYGVALTPASRVGGTQRFSVCR